jgi:hypothetical protein
MTQRASLRQYISANNNVPSLVFPRCTQQRTKLIKKKKCSKKFAAVCLFVRALPIDFALLGRKRKYIKLKITAKSREKRTWIATVRVILGALGTFPIPLLSRYRLPLRSLRINSKESIPQAYVVWRNLYGAPELIPRNEFRQLM